VRTEQESCFATVELRRRGGGLEQAFCRVFERIERSIRALPDFPGSLTFLSEMPKQADNNVSIGVARGKPGSDCARFGGCVAAVAPVPGLHGHPSTRPLPDAEGNSAVMDTDTLVTRIKSEFNESPGMCLTLRQGARLWGIAPEECARIVDLLVSQEFLRWTRNGELVRTESGGYSSRCGAEAGL
jgi:hypothetical protein